MNDKKDNFDQQLLNDPELVENFAAEAKEHLDSIEEDFLTLEQQQENPDQELLNKIFRAIHSVKGAAGFLGLKNMTDLSHVMETLLSHMRSGKMKPQAENIDALLAGVDLLTLMLDDIEHNQDVEIAGVYERLDGLLGRQKGPSVPARKRPGKPAAAKETQISTPARGTVDMGNTVRIQVDVLDKLMVQAGELVLVRNQHLLSVDESDAQARSFAHRLDLITSELQKTIIGARMQPIDRIVGKFPRVVRDLGRKLGKQIQITISGGESELDKTILESLADPLTHIIRNCCDHGIEAPADRRRAGKPEQGQIVLSACHEAGGINIEIRDDGRGIDPEMLRGKVLEKGLKSEAELEQMEDKELLRLVFLPGFSTADIASDVSGRGVGLDVVKTGIEKLGGSFDLESTVGKGATVMLRLPLTLAIMPALIVTSGGNLFALPQTSLVELVGLYDDEVRQEIEYADGLEVFRLRERLLPMLRLSEVLARPERFTRETAAEITENWRRKQENSRKKHLNALETENGGEFMRSLNFVVLRAGNRRYGLIVDQILGIEEIVVKPMHWAVKSLGIYAGAAIMGSGEVALILDVEGIAAHARVMLDIDMAPSAMDKRITAEELQRVLLFKSGEKEQFAIPLPLIGRIAKIDLSEIEQIGEREYITIDGKSIRVLCLDQALDVSPVLRQGKMYLILPRYFKRPVGLLVSDLIDVEETALELDVESYPADGLLGSLIIGHTMTLFIDIYRMVEIVDPEWFADRRRASLKKPGASADSSKKILLLEDIPFFRHLVRTYLEADGYKVITADNGQVGLERLNESRFDLIVSDLEMPVMNGWDFLEYVRKGRQQSDIPAVALTALDSQEDRKRALACGFDRYEVKLDRERFLASVAELLGLAEKQELH